MAVIDAVRLESTFINSFLHQDSEDPTRFMVYETRPIKTSSSTSRLSGTVGNLTNPDFQSF